MQAVILAGGEGTRLRPLTTNVAKPIVTLVDRPFIVYMLQWLRHHGVDDVILCCGFGADGVREVLGDGSEHGMRLRYVAESEPLGTGGPLLLASDLLDERFVVCNGDILTDMDLSAQLEAHERSGAVATLALVAVEDPRVYGLVRCEEDGSVAEFVEKPGRDRRWSAADQRRRLCARAQRARSDRARACRLDRARGLARADRQGPPRPPQRRLLARHRHPRALPPGQLRHHHRRGRGRRARRQPGLRCDRRALRDR